MRDSSAEWEKVKGMLRVKRTCKGCDLCCTAMPVNSINKPMSVRCEHLTDSPGKSCGIYANRPMDCAEFLCLWRGSPVIPEYMFPARSGLVMAPGDIHATPPILTVFVDPARPDAWMQYRDELKMLALIFNCIVCVGLRELATTSFSPCGNEHPRAMFPHYYKQDGLVVGAPERDFRQPVRTWVQMGRLMWTGKE